MISLLFQIAEGHEPPIIYVLRDKVKLKTHFPIAAKTNISTVKALENLKKPKLRCSIALLNTLHDY